VTPLRTGVPEKGCGLIRNAGLAAVIMLSEQRRDPLAFRTI